ncbi:uncharacterized protein LOC135216177 [Macrobrachium nipponense]|uniref:uncharacterized protein LOC135216177 n=1 Tax=Macrobrachium nipponense TaxID=159736 RepID=UPI0030C8005A
MGEILRSSVTTIVLVAIFALGLTAGSAMKFMNNVVMKDEFLSDSKLNATSVCSCRQFCFAWPNCTALSVVDDGQGRIACYFSDKTNISSESFTKDEEGYSWIKQGKHESSSTVNRSSTTQTSVNTNSTTTAASTTTTTTNATTANLTTAYNGKVVTTDTTTQPSRNGLLDSLDSQPSTEKLEASTTTIQLQSETYNPTTTRSTTQTVGGMQDCNAAAVDGCLYKGGMTSYWNAKGACQRGGGILFVAKKQEEFGQLQEFLKKNWNTGTQFSEPMLVGIHSHVWTDGLDFSLTPLTSHWKGSRIPDPQKLCAIVVYSSDTVALDAIDCGQEYPALCTKEIV